MQRKLMHPLILYADEFGFQRRFKKLTPHQLELLRPEQCDKDFLAKLLINVEQRFGWIREGEYGNTELTFYRSDGTSRSFVLQGTAFTSAVENLSDKLNRKSVVSEYVSLINRTFPPFTEALPPDLPRSDTNH
jgi:hypothetical protein